MHGDLVWIELPGGLDCHVTGAFYARVFGWVVEDDGVTVRFHDPSGSLAGAFVEELPPSAACGTILYLATEDAASSLASAVAAGAEAVRPREALSGGRGYRALLRDPAGTVVGVLEPWRAPEAAAAAT